MPKKGRKRKISAEGRDYDEWEKTQILPDSLRDEMESMWELPQIYHFLQLTKDVLHISHLSMFEVERMLLMPKASQQLANIMTCLLSSPSTKSKQQEVPPMPYKFWTNILMQKLKGWFKIYEAKQREPVKVFDALGIESEFWSVFPEALELEGRDFESFNFRQRVWLLKALCDTAQHSRKLIQEEIAKQPTESQFETVLGVDRYGARYVYFPQFLHNDLRVYRHSMDNKILSSFKSKNKTESENENSMESKSSESKSSDAKQGCKRPKKRRKSRWSNGLTPKKTSKRRVNELIDQTDSNSNSNSNSNSTDGSFVEGKTNSPSLDGGSFNETHETKGDVDDDNSNLTNKTDNISPTSEEQRKSSNTSPILENSLNTSKTDDEKLKEISSVKVTTDKSSQDLALDESLQDSAIAESLRDSMIDDKLQDSTIEDSQDSIKSNNSESQMVDSKDSKSDDEKLSENKQSENKSDCETDGNGDLLDTSTRRSERIKVKTENEEAEIVADVCDTEELTSIELRDRLCRIPVTQTQDLSISRFQLVADSLESLRDIIETITMDKGGDGTRPTWEEDLLKRMKILLNSMENVGPILEEATKKAKNKLLQEWNDFENLTPDEQSSENWSGSQGWCLVSPERPSQSQTTAKTTNEAKSLDATLDDSKVDDNKKENENNQQAEEAGEKSTNEVDIKQEDGEEPSSKKNKTSQEKEDNAETKRPVRSLRARGVSSYIEHLFDEDSSDEEYRSKLSEANPIADVRVAYIPSTSTATSESSKKSPTSDFEEEEQSEDSDQDWCLPGTRKKKRKRMSFGRRFKTMQAIRTESEQIRRNDQMVEAAGAQNLRIEKVHTLGPDGKVYELSVEDVVAPSTPTVNNTSPNQTIYVNPPVGSVVAKQNVAAYPQQQQTRNLQQQQQKQQWPRKVVGRYPHTTMQQVQPPPMPRMIRMVPPRPGTVMGPRGPNNAAQRPTMGPRGPGGVTQRPRMNAQPRIISSTTLSPNRPLPNQQNVTQQFNSRQKQSYLHEAASKRMPNNALRPGQRMVPSQTKAGPANQVPRRTPTKAGPPGRGAARVATNNSATTLIVLSDSDEEIQVVKTPSNNMQTPKAKTSPPVKKSYVDDTPVSVKKVLPPELLQRMEDGGISIVPIKPAPKPPNPSSTQIVVVVNETGSHYALVLPNGSKLILTPEQVAQIRESNGGKLVV
ncbi:uncharacterized protein KIAA2026-like isoform X2 [Trichogramma pretiosum]|uniref:uncharacterized protein KIAA2026-like isoform X2 n=1 Tax=Trichogramma pretiosum TaxID=7493 RepID=UPI0006C970C2|nr:uncharacterized protein KIAA2026-like isoform X2 [Trichogramma pretiosum]